MSYNNFKLIQIKLKHLVYKVAILEKYISLDFCEIRGVVFLKDIKLFSKSLLRGKYETNN